jgi:hypothetical protein
MIYNPNNLPENDLPIIYGWNNGGRAGFMQGRIVAQDGTLLGQHLCSNEGYMVSDLGMRPELNKWRHEDFKKHYRDGYRTEFVSYERCKPHMGLNAALAKLDAKLKEKNDD